MSKSKYESSKEKLAAEYHLMSIIDKNKESLKLMKKAEAHDFIRKNLGDETPITTTRINTALRTFGILFTRDKGFASNARVKQDDIIHLAKALKDFMKCFNYGLNDPLRVAAAEDVIEAADKIIK